MRYLRVQRLFEVLQDGSGGNDSTSQMVDAKALERLDLKVLVKLLVSRLFGKHPVVHLESAEARAEVALEVVAMLTVVEHLLGTERADEFLDVVIGTLADEEFTCRDVEERHTTGRLAKVYGGQEVVLLIVQHVVLHGHTRRHQFGDASLDEFLGQLGVLQLVANGYALASPDELGQVGVEGMVGESRHLVALIVAVVAMSEGDAENL